MILRYFRGPGAHFGDLGAHFEDISDFNDFGDASGAKGYLHFQVKIRPGTNFFQSCVFSVFSSAPFSDFFVIWGAPRLNFGSVSTPFWEPWAFEKTAETV